jgi:hypothetical protein
MNHKHRHQLAGTREACADATTKYGANGGKSIAAYATKIRGVDNGTEAEQKAAKQEVLRQMWGWEVYDQCNHMVAPDRYFRQFAEIHAAPEHLWRELAERMVDEGWTVEQTKAAVKKVQPPKPPNPIRTT